ncbi:hypothetical protein Tco_0052672 [Tanacetum coccineum]
MLSSKGVKPYTSASRSQPSSNTKKDKIQRTPSSTQKNKVEAHPRTVKSSLKNKNCFVEPKGNANVQHSKLNVNYELLCVKCNGCMLYENYDLCVLDFINDVNSRTKSKSVKKNSKRKVWKPTGKMITTIAEVPRRKPIAQENVTPKPVVTLVYSRKPRKSKTNVPVSKPKIIKSRSANNNEPSKSWGSIVSDVPSSSLDECMSSKLFSGTVKFRNDHVAKILGYGDNQMGNVTISRVYYVEGLRHNLFPVGQFCDSNLEVSFRQHTCFIRNLEGVDLLTGSQGNNLYTLSLRDIMAEFVDGNYASSGYKCCPSFSKKKICVVSYIKTARGFQNPFYLKKAQQLEPKLYDGNVIKNTSAIVIPNSEETLMLAKESLSKILFKQQDPMVLEKKVNTTPVDYVVLNQLSQDFEKLFVPQTKFSAEQAFWSQNFMNSSDLSPSCRPTKVEILKELPIVSMVNMSLKKLKHHLSGFDVVVKERTTATSITEGSWVFKHTKSYFRNEIIPFVKALKDIFNTFDQYLIDELSEVQNVFHQMEQEKDLVITALKDELRKLKVKDLADNVVTQHTITLEMLKIDVEPIAPRLLNNRTAHSDYLRHTQEQAAILREIMEQGKSQNPLNNSLDSVCRPKCFPWYWTPAAPSIMTEERFSAHHFVKIFWYIKIRMITWKDIGIWRLSEWDVTISRVLLREGLDNNLFSVGQFCDSNLEVAFRQHTCFIRNLEGVDLLTGSRGNNLYTLSLGDMMASSPICLLSKASDM